MDAAENLFKLKLLYAELVDELDPIKVSKVFDLLKYFFGIYFYTFLR